jgi:hypothetical protein
MRKVLNEDNHREILERASRMNDEEIELLAATLDPKPEVADSIRRVPVRGVPVLRQAISLASGSNDSEQHAAGEHRALLPLSPTEASTSEPSGPAASVPPGVGSTVRLEPTWIALAPKPSELEPLDGERYAIRMTVSKEFVDELRQVKDALSHVVPGGRMEDVFRECMRIARETCERRMRGSKTSRATPARSDRGNEGSPEPANADTPTFIVKVATDSAPPATAEVPWLTGEDGATSFDARADPMSTDGSTFIVKVATDSPPPATAEVRSPGEDSATTSIVKVTGKRGLSDGDSLGSRYVPVAVRREVFERDEGCCTFVGLNGRRCRSTFRLQFHHKIPFGKGGPPTAENLTLLCSHHNRHEAYEDYGAAHMDRFLAQPP